MECTGEPIYYIYIYVHICACVNMLLPSINCYGFAAFCSKNLGPAIVPRSSRWTRPPIPCFGARSSRLHAPWRSAMHWQRELRFKAKMLRYAQCKSVYRETLAFLCIHVRSMESMEFTESPPLWQALRSTLLLWWKHPTAHCSAVPWRLPDIARINRKHLWCIFAFFIL